MSDYCREIEAYLCRKNDGHLIRIVGPSFDLVSRWAETGVPLKVAFAGIDRCFDRYYRKGPRRRPVRIDFCEADVLDVFDEWRRATGIPSATARDSAGEGDADRRRSRSLSSHLERALLRITDLRMDCRLGAERDAFLDRLTGALDETLAAARGARGETRRQLLDRLSALDAELVAAARAAVGREEQHGLERAAADELSPFRDRLDESAYARALTAIVDRAVRERFRLPTLSFT
jgi:hypothetical protein